MREAGCVSGLVKETRVGFHRLLFGGVQFSSHAVLGSHFTVIAQEFEFCDGASLFLGSVTTVLQS